MSGVRSLGLPLLGNFSPLALININLALGGYFIKSNSSFVKEVMLFIILMHKYYNDNSYIKRGSAYKAISFAINNMGEFASLTAK